jgi:hypothetical protein
MEMELKPIFIIAIVAVAMIGVMVPSDVWAASSSSDHCPKGSEEVVKGLDITCVSTNDTPKNCPSGTYYGKDNQGNFACRNVDSNNVIDVRNNLAQNQIVTKTTPNSSELQILNTIFDPNTILYVVIGISIIAIIVVIVVRRSKPKYSKSYSKRTRRYSRRFKMRVGGLISLVIGFVLIQYMAVPAIRTGNTVESIALLAGMILFIAGLLTLVLSLNKRNQQKVGRGLDKVGGMIGELAKIKCFCCKCQNCDSYHNHWTHDDDDHNRRH